MIGAVCSDDNFTPQNRTRQKGAILYSLCRTPFTKIINKRGVRVYLALRSEGGGLSLARSCWPCQELGRNFCFYFLAPYSQYAVENGLYASAATYSLSLVMKRHVSVSAAAIAAPGGSSSPPPYAALVRAQLGNSQACLRRRARECSRSSEIAQRGPGPNPVVRACTQHGVIGT